jgi:hypothetical protein
VALDRQSCLTTTGKFGDVTGNFFALIFLKFTITMQIKSSTHSCLYSLHLPKVQNLFFDEQVDRSRHLGDIYWHWAKF